MANPFKKARPGDPLVIPAEAFNTFIDTALTAKRQQHGLGRTLQRQQQQTGIVLIRNESGASRARFDVLGISGPVIKPVANLDEFKSRVVLKGVAPTEDHVGRFVVLLEPLAINAIGRACVDGVCVARIKMDGEELGFAEIEAGTTNALISIPTGSARMLWVEPIEDRVDPAIAWAVVQVGSAASDAVPPQLLTRFKVQSIANDWLVCRTWDGTVLGTVDYIVVKPEALRHDIIFYPWLDVLTTVDVQEIDVEETLRDLTENWRVTPPYWDDCELVAALIGPTGVSGVPGQGNQTVATVQSRYDDDDIRVTFAVSWALLQGMIVDVVWVVSLDPYVEERRDDMLVVSGGEDWARIRFGYGDPCPAVGTAVTVERISWGWLDINKAARAWAVEYAV